MGDILFELDYELPKADSSKNGRKVAIILWSRVVKFIEKSH